MLPGDMGTKAKHDGLFCELYWGSTRTEAWNFPPEQTRVLAAPDETAPLPLYGFPLPEEPFLLAERTAQGYRVFVPPGARVEHGRRGDALREVPPDALHRAEARAWLDVTPEERLRLTQGELSLLLSPSVAGPRTRGLQAKDWGLLLMLAALLLSVPVGLMLAGHSPEHMAESNARALAAARELEDAERKRLGVDSPAQPRAPDAQPDAGVRTTLPGVRIR
ncbi:hypothetical protein [Archangium primigenium]|uniref:hypothetical protein n=1 Tax=[Archangium] primigenium TaxID=2792470 RepID=UPI00195E8DCD|nr:hypothetical protein [Archangium primigenium]MBM7114791.1 hypothetical protein [Archangium primigenium]